MSSLGNKIKYYRTKKGLTRRTLANAIDITENGLYKIETDQRTPSFTVVAAIAKALGVDVGEFV
ncbi:MAG: helix-turn-helix transcriptional regulator [Candidatus Margulisiibacteriota bacterium]